MDFVIITGLSGAGKTQVVQALEDFGFFCIDNMPPQLILKFAEIYNRSSDKIKKAAIVSDIRSENLGELAESLDELKQNGYSYEIVFLEASDEVLIKRYKETRRKHPLAEDGGILDGINKEREALKGIKERADHIIDTSRFKPAQLKEHISRLYGSEQSYEGIVINILSFGFKYGIPMDSDLVFDVRFLPNPFYIPELREHTGLESEVSDYVMSFEQSEEFLKRLKDMVEYLIPHYIEEGKSQLVISIGCTGGHHRSVTIAEALHKYLAQGKHCTVITHRDINKGV